MTGVAQVGRMGERPPARRLDGGGHGGEPVLAPGGQQHRAAGAGQAVGHHLPEPRRGPGDDRRLALQREELPEGAPRLGGHPQASGAIRSATAVISPALGDRTRMRA